MSGKLKLDKVERFRIYVYWAFRGLLAATAIFAIFSGQWNQLGFLTLAFFLTLLPRILESQTGIDYPGEIDIIVLFFIIGSMYLGEMHDYYEKYHWWDTFLHSISGVIIGGLGFSVVFILNGSKKLVFKLSPLFVCMFAFGFAVSIGVVWEIFEFFMDQTFGMNMQRSGLVDTMWDLIVDCIGALLFSILGYYHMKHDIRIFAGIERKFFRMNPELHKKS